MEWNFDNTYLKLPKIFFTEIYPESLANPKFVLFNNEVAKKLNIENNIQSKNDILKIFFNNKKSKYIKPFSQAYAGHQFGYFTILGDGRAHIIGEVISKNNERFDIQLKGSGKTPYSRNGDGKATLGTMIREFIISESMNILGIPTTNSLGVIKTGEEVLREKIEKGAILIRVAKSHIRIGTFQYANMYEDKNYIKELTNYTIDRHYPELINKKNKVEIFLEKVMIKQINLIINWLRVGFIHGVMNTDNMSIAGETIDYGPCAFMDEYNPNTVFSSIDRNGRYAYKNQSKIVLWNLSRFAESILLLLDRDEKIAIKKAQKILNKFQTIYSQGWLKMMKNKLGLIEENKNDIKLIQELLDIMHVYKLDYTNTFVDLNNNEINKHKQFKTWIEKYDERKEMEKKDKLYLKNIMKKNNPKIIPRNHIVANCIREAEENNYNYLSEFLESFKKTYDEVDFPESLKKLPSNEEKVFQTFCGT